ncbi:MAG: YggT family protein [Spirochaetaceae bacterium]|jgi:YggT family protein|nr:YggT family protein [Spirochaetaceae bacterium]
MSFIFGLLGGVTGIYMFLILIRVLMSWLQGPYLTGKPVQLLARVTDPYLNWFSRLSGKLPLRLGMIDFSPILGIGLLSVANSVFNTIATMGRISVGIVLALLADMLWSVISFGLSFTAVILILRLIAYWTNRNTFSGFWSIIDNISKPILHGISRILFNRRVVQYKTALLVSTAAVIIVRLLAGSLARVGIGLLARLPF